MQDATKVLLGTILESGFEITHHDGNPSTFVAGLAVTLASTGSLSLLKSAGQRIGVSVGRQLSNTVLNTAVCRAGTKVPIIVALKRARGTVTVTSYANLVAVAADTITVGATGFVAQSGAATPGTATFQAASSNNATAASLALQINAHATAGALVRAVAVGAVVTIAAIAEGTAGNSIVLTYTDGASSIGATVSGSGTLASGSADPADIAFVTKGQPVYTDDISGKATDGTLPGCTISNAVYRDVLKTGVQEDSSTGPCAIIDMPGGL